ncbi:MAG: cupin domain-containing protein [Bdellovibrionales bacterium]|nr:cupin domain-containing protein [Bdellovibrionales bacterium]
MLTHTEIIKKLNLIPLEDEGGFFSQTFKDSSSVLFHKSNSTDKLRAASTAIYFLITPDHFSVLHRLPQVEIFHFYLGSPVEMLQICPLGNVKKIILGHDVLGDQQVQVIIDRATWQGTRLVPGGDWALMGATVSPGFEFSDLQVASRSELILQHPKHADEILQFTRS